MTEKRGVYFNSIFAVRRLLFAALLVLASDWPWLQLQGLLLLQLLQIIYTGLWRPRDTKITNMFELINEFLALVVCYHLLMFTDFFTEVESRYWYVGMSMIFFTLVLMLVNIALLLYYLALKLRSYKRYRESKEKWLSKHRGDACEPTNVAEVAK